MKIYTSAKNAFVDHNTDAPVIAIVPYEKGYYPIYTSSSAEQLNKGKFTDAEIQSAIEASMFGWHCPAATSAINAIKRQP